MDNILITTQGEELTSLPEWLDSGVLGRVQQIGLELHLPAVHSGRTTN